MGVSGLAELPVRVPQDDSDVVLRLAAEAVRVDEDVPRRGPGPGAGHPQEVLRVRITKDDDLACGIASLEPRLGETQGVVNGEVRPWHLLAQIRHEREQPGGLVLDLGGSGPVRHRACPCL